MDLRKSQIKIMFDAIELCVEYKLYAPALIIIYSTIDTLASLDIPASKDNVQGKDFEAWVKKYLLPVEGIDCSALDLYGARCGLLHTYKPESKLSKRGKAKEIYYTYGEISNKKFLQVLKKLHNRKVAVVHINKFLNALEKATNKFNKDISNDKEKKIIVEKRLRKYFTDIPKADIDKLHNSIFKK